MKILIISHIFPPSIDGGSRVVWKIGEWFHQNKNQVTALSSNCSSTDDFVNPKSKPLDSFPSYPIKTIRLPVHKSLRRPLKAVSFIFPKNSYPRHLLEVYQKGPLFKLLPLTASIIAILKFKPDLIIAGPLPTATVLYASFLQKLTRSKLLLNASFHPTDRDFYKTPLISVLKSADFIWSLTEYEKDIFATRFNIPGNKIKVLGCAVDKNSLAPAFPASNSKPSLLFIGSFAKHKGIDTLLSAFSTINRAFPQSRLTLAGQKTLYWPYLESQIDKLPPAVKAKIEIKFGFCNSELTTLIDNSSILIQPSLQESFGLTIIEAWSRFKPVIAADIPSSSELITKSRGGLLFKAGDSHDLAAKIISLINNPSKAADLGKNGHSYVQDHYTWDKIGQRIYTWISKK